jgi:hypothetical protein
MDKEFTAQFEALTSILAERGKEFEVRYTLYIDSIFVSLEALHSL